MIKRLSQFIQSQGISVRAFELSISASDGMIRRAINNNSDIQSKWIVSIADNYPNLSIDWLITGNGAMLRDEQAQPAPPPVAQADASCEATIYYKMYKEKDEENKILIERIGSLKERLRQLEVIQETTQSIDQQKQSGPTALIEESPDAFTQDSFGASGKDVAHMRKPTSSRASSGSKI